MCHINDQLLAAVAALRAVYRIAHRIVDVVNLLVQQFAIQPANELPKMLILLRLTVALYCYESKVANILFQMV